MKCPWHIESVKLIATKHFALKYLKQWGWDFHDLRDAIREAYRIDEAGHSKYEIYVQKSGYKKIITVYYETEAELLCRTGSQGGKQP